MKGHGETTRCTEKEYLFGRMAENTKESTSMIKRKAMGNSVGQMDDATKEVGKMASRMGEGPTEIEKEFRETGPG